MRAGLAEKSVTVKLPSGPEATVLRSAFMTVLRLAVFQLTPVALGEPLSAQEALEKTIAFHDPDE